MQNSNDVDAFDGDTDAMDFVTDDGVGAIDATTMNVDALTC